MRIPGPFSPLFAAAMLMAAPLAAEEQYSVELEAGGSITVALPAPPIASLSHAGRLYVATGARQVVVFALSGDRATPLATLPVSGELVGLTLVNGRPAAVLYAEDAVPLEVAAAESRVDAGPAASSGPSKSEALAAPPAIAGASAQAVKVAAGEATIDRGLDHGFSVGDVVRFFTQGPSEQVDQSLGPGQATHRWIEAGDGEIVLAGSGQSRVVLDRGARVSPGDRVERIEPRDRRRLRAPARLGNLMQLSLAVRPFLSTIGAGAGSINTLALAWHAQEPYFLEARIEPLAFAVREGGGGGAISLQVSAGYDERYFGIGLGLGFAGSEGLSGGGVAQIVRLGARDGLRLELRNTFIQDDGFEWGSTDGRLGLPVGNLTDVYIQLGGGSLGYFLGEGGVFTWLKGNGDRGSLGLSAGAGFSFLDGRGEYPDLVGPMISVGLVRRQ